MMNENRRVRRAQFYRWIAFLLSGLVVTAFGTYLEPAAHAANYTYPVSAKFQTTAYPSGEYATPLEAADALDAYLRNISENLSGTTTIQFPAGHGFYTRGRYQSPGVEFPPAGQKGFVLKTGWVLKGTLVGGAKGTTVRLATAQIDMTPSRLWGENCLLDSETSNAAQQPSSNPQNITVQDINLDCNYSGVVAQTGYQKLMLVAIHLRGLTGFTIRNVEILNSASRRYQDGEAFPIWVGGTGSGSPGTVLIENCGLSSYQMGYCSAITVAYNLTGIIRNNTVVFPPYNPGLPGNLSYNQSHFGLNATGGGTQNLQFIGNTVVNATRGFNSDTAQNTGVLLQGNTFTDCSYGVWVCNAMNGVCENNQIQLRSNAGPEPIGIVVFQHAASNQYAGGWTIRNNSVAGSIGLGVSLSHGNPAVFESSGNTVTGNYIAPTLFNNVTTSLGNVLKPGNRRHVVSYAPCAPGTGNLVPIGFPSECNYCTAGGQASTYGFIQRVVFGGIDNTSGDNGGYRDFTAYPFNYPLAANVSRGVAYGMTVTPTYGILPGPLSMSVYIDFNHDGDFTDPGEYVLSQAGQSLIQGNITIPGNASVGSTRMRVCLSRGFYASSCQTFPYGEVEDYTVHIQ